MTEGLQPTPDPEEMVESEGQEEFEYMVTYRCYCRPGGHEWEAPQPKKYASSVKCLYGNDSKGTMIGIRSVRKMVSS